MIAYLPQPYEDELFYSVLCRAYTHSGYFSHKEALKDMLYTKSNNPSIEFLGHFNTDFESLIKQVYPIDHLILNHTMFPQYSRFIPLQQKMDAMHHLVIDYCDPHHLFCILPRADCDLYLKYCPLCVQEDRNRYGETFWHRQHQIRNMLLCPKHTCYLEKSNVLAKSEKVFTLSSAEEHTPLISPRKATNSHLIECSRYMAAVFASPMDFTTDTPISSIFYYALQGSKYMPKSSKARNTKRLSEDLKNFYDSIGVSEIASIYQIQRGLLGDRFDFSVVCQIAFFLGISVEDLTHPNLTEQQINQEQTSHYIKGKAPIDWDTLDSEIAPQLEQLAFDTYHGTYSRPSRVSERLVYRELQLNAHSLENLPRCRAILEEYSETYEESWARRLIWAFNHLKADRGEAPFYWTDIRNISGVKAKHLSEVLPLLPRHTDANTAETITSLINP